MIVSPTDGEVARRNQTVNVERTKGRGKKKKKNMDWIEQEAEGIVRCSSFLLWGAEMKEKHLSHGESEMSTD